MPTEVHSFGYGITNSYTLTGHNNSRPVIVKRSLYRADGDRHEVAPMPDGPRFWIDAEGGDVTGTITPGGDSATFDFTLGQALKAVKQGNRVVIVKGSIYNGSAGEDQYLCAPMTGGSEELFNQNELTTI